MGTIIKVENCFSWLATDNQELKQNLWRVLRHREKNYFHSTLYKRKLWDGFTEFFKLKTGRFLTGLLPEVEAALVHWKSPYQIIDNRPAVKWQHQEIDENFLNQWLDVFNSNVAPGDRRDDFTLRDYQPELANAIIKYNRGVIQAPTSAGKTAIMVSILKALPPNTPTLVLANRKGLCDQNYKELTSWGFDVGRLYDKFKEPNMMTVATWQSVHKIAPLLPKIRCLIVDEIHEMMSKGPQKVYDKMKACSIRVAVSATPFKFGGKDKTQKYRVKGYFGPVMKAKSAGEKGVLTTKVLQERKILSSSICMFYPITHPSLPYEIYMDAVTKGIAENWGFHDIVKKLALSLKGRTLILVERIAHGDYLESLIPGALWIRGKDTLDTRNYVVEELKKSKKNRIAIATQGIFNSGVNVYLHNLINAAGGQATHQIIQRMGRGLRTAKDKERLRYFDFVYEINDYLWAHSRSRIKILRDEGHEVVVKDEIDI